MIVLIFVLIFVFGVNVIYVALSGSLDNFGIIDWFIILEKVIMIV